MKYSVKYVSPQVKPITMDFTGFNLNDTAFATLNKLGLYLTGDNLKNMKYSREQVRNFLNNPDKNEAKLREVSRYLYIFSGHYFRLINYFSDMLTFDHILSPINADLEIVQKSNFSNSYKKCVKFVENYDIKYNCSEIMSICLLEDVYYGVERWNGDSFLLQRLPSDYCKITGIENGLYTFSFDMSYFDAKKTDINSKPLDIINNYPEIFNVLYRTYKSTKNRWQQIPSDVGVCFKFNKNTSSCVPPFIQIYEEIMDIEDNKEQKKAVTKSHNFKLIHQKIPTKKEPKSEKDMVFSAPTVKEFHSAIKSTLPPNIGIVSSPMDLIPVDFERKVGAESKTELTVEEELFGKVGVAKPLFVGGDNNSISLNRSIEMDESLMFKMLRQFEKFFKNRLHTISGVKFKLLFPDITIYNRDGLLKSMISLGQNGFPKSLIVAVAGYSVSDIYSLNLLENEHLKMLDSMIPLQSSYVQSAEAGRPSKDNNDLSDSGLKTKDADANKKRAK